MCIKIDKALKDDTKIELTSVQNKGYYITHTQCQSHRLIDTVSNSSSRFGGGGRGKIWYFIFNNRCPSSLSHYIVGLITGGLDRSPEKETYIQMLGEYCTLEKRNLRISLFRDLGEF